MIRFGSEVCANWEAASQREWLETNALGGFASGTVAGANTRRYHGLLVAASAPLERQLLLAKIEETVSTGADLLELACNVFAGGVYPEGYRALAEFRLDPWPTWRWRFGGVQIEKSICLIAGENTTVIEYRISGAAEATLRLKPLIAFRDYHATTHANPALNEEVTESEGAASIQPYADLTRLHFGYGQAVLSRTGDWYRQFQYPREQERGLDSEEDLFQPFELTMALTPEAPGRIIVSTEPVAGRDAAQLLDAERARRLESSTELVPALHRAAGQFLIARGDQTTVIAGYHWFTDWGRDTMIALPGLALGTGQTEVFRHVVRAFLAFFRQGLMPNRFPDAGADPEYNSTDATLWFVEALREYAESTGDFDFIREQCWSALRDIVEWRERGTLFGIRVEADGLLTGGQAGVQLTWMDAKVGDRVITERAGKPVEIQALWYNALCSISDLAVRFAEGDFGAKCAQMATLTKRSFNAQFWNEAESCLFDVVHGDSRDGAIRPNQILAFSLRHAILEKDRWGRVLDVVTRELLTPFGLRTLSPRDSRYCGRYEGDASSRDGAYHQGTVWPWLLGPYVRAARAVNEHSDLSHILEPFREHLLTAGLGQISEIFDGDAPHTPRGCIAQAWSVAELLRVAQLIAR